MGNQSKRLADTQAQLSSIQRKYAKLLVKADKLEKAIQELGCQMKTRTSFDGTTRECVYWSYWNCEGCPNFKNSWTLKERK